MGIGPPRRGLSFAGIQARQSKQRRPVLRGVRVLAELDGATGKPTDATLTTSGDSVYPGMGGGRSGAMQFIEASIIGLRSAVITLKNRASPLTFVLFPMVHVGERAFYDEVAARARECQLILAEGVPSRFAPAQAWMAGIRHDRLVDQITALDLEALGVPVRWEEPDVAASSSRSLRDKVVDPVAAVAMRLLGRFGGALDVPSVEQTDAQDFDWADASSRIERFFLYNMVYLRDEKLTRALGEIHRDMSAELITVAVVYGAAHMIAVTDYLIGTLHYYVADAEWLMVANAPS